MGSYFLRGIIIGLLFGMPAGAVGALTVQRTLKYGPAAGLVTGLGSSVADCCYACVGAFGLTMLSDVLLKYQSIIHILGGVLILAMGVHLLLGKDKGVQNDISASGGIRLFLSSFAVGITNPAAILTFLFAFSWFGITGQTGTGQGIWLVCGVFTGTYIWWGTLSASVAFLKKRTGNHSQRHMNQIFGTILILFGTVVFIRTFL